MPARPAGLAVRRIASSVSRSHWAASGSGRGRCPAASRSKRPAATGSSVSASSSESTTATDIVRARSAKSCPSGPVMNRMGRKIATEVAVEASSAGATSGAPAAMACGSVWPSWRRRTMFSSTMIAASSTRPTAKAMPASEMTFRLRPVSCSVAKAPSRHTGMANPTSSVARQRRRKTYSTSVASSPPSTRLLRTSAMARRICTEAS